MENERLVDNYNNLIPTMNVLLNEGIDVWEEHNNLEGYGFKAIRENKWVSVSIIMNYSTPNVYVVSCHERNGNLLCEFLCKELGRKSTTNFSEVYDIVKDMLE